MILVVGGLNGFIGSNTTEALVDLGKDARSHATRTKRSLASFRSISIIGV
jgi:nucleoside-diphosphate-sugar epimerase